MDSLKTLGLRKLGRVDYRQCWRAMQKFTDTRDASTADELWLVEHPAVFTLGQAGKREHLLAPGNIPVIESDRGGQVTYHGPGQVVAYPLVNLNRLGIGVREFVRRIEEVVILVLAGYGVCGERREGAPGIYVQGAKIAALGLRVRRGCTFHGLAFNVAMELEPFSRINPCGLQGLKVTQLLDFEPAATPARVGKQIAEALLAQLGYESMAVRPAEELTD